MQADAQRGVLRQTTLGVGDSMNDEGLADAEAADPSSMPSSGAHPPSARTLNAQIKNVGPNFRVSLSSARTAHMNCARIGIVSARYTGCGDHERSALF